MAKSTEQKFLLQQNPWYQSAVGSAIVSAVFVVVIATLMLIHTYHMKVTDHNRGHKLENLRREYQTHPANQELADQIRTFDTRMRRDQLARLRFLHRGVLLFVLSLAVFVAALYWLRSFQNRLPHPQPPGNISAQQVQQAMWARMAITLALIVLGGAGLYLAMRTSKPPAIAEVDQEEPEEPVEPAEPVYASWPQMQEYWPVFRGPGGGGICPFENIPTEWDGPSEKNILWKKPIPSDQSDPPAVYAGHNSPILWDDRLFITGATEGEQKVFCFDAHTGALLWASEVPISPSPERKDMDIMEDTGYAASTAATNGTYVAAIFADGQVGCFDMEGALQWSRSLGIPSSAYGYASSLTAYENKVIIQMDQDYEPGRSKLIALDFSTGNTIWQTDRPVPNSWTSPTVVSIGNTMQILTSGSPWVIAYDPADGRQLWKADCLGGDVAPTQIAADGMVFAIEPYNKLVAIKATGASGDVTESAIAWESEESMPDICSPISNGELVWTLTSEGDLSCFDVSNGQKVYEEDLDAIFQASPSLVGDTLYLLSMKGKMMLIKADRTFEKLGENELGEEIFSSPAFAAGRIYLRGTEHLYCIGTQP